MARENDVNDDLIDTDPVIDAADELDQSSRELADDAFAEDFDGVSDDAVVAAEDRADDGIAGDFGELDDDAAKPKEGVDRGDGRDVKGKFATAEEKAAAEKAAADAKPKAETKPDAAAGAAPAAGEAAKPAATAAEQPKWEPFKVRVEKADVPIPEATITKINGYHMLGIKDADFPAFASRLSKAVSAEKMWRDLSQGLKTLDAERAAPQAESDAEIEARLTLELLKPMLGEILTPEQVENLSLRVDNAKMKAKDAHAAARKTYFDGVAAKEKEALQPAEDEQAQLTGIATEMLDLVDKVPELKGITEQQIRAAYADMVPLRKALFWKEADGWYAKREEMLKALKRHMGSTSGTATTTATPAPAGTTADASTKPADTKPTAADRFNDGQNSAAKPGTTSVKANRGTSTPRRAAPPKPGETRGRERVKTAAMVAEDNYRTKTRNWLRSDSLDDDSLDEE